MFNLIFLFIFFINWGFLIYQFDHCHYFYYVFVFSLFPILSFLISLIFIFLLCLLCMIIMKNLRVNHIFKYIVTRHISIFLLRLLRVKIVFKNYDLIPSKENLIIYANHKSWFDAFIILSVIPRCLAFTPKDTLYKYSLINYCFNSFDCIQIFRKNNRETFKNLIKGIENIKKGLAIVIFPEGGIKDIKNEKAVEFLPGAFKIAFKSEAIILPLSIKGSINIKNFFFLKRKIVEVHCHKTINFQDYKLQNTKQISEKTREIINSIF
ncbi:1-acyl-sn-glycerol-3-phosphate acyltransferase [Candidatus Phytoplasma mali]|uniref:1-acyl-sn-glycerol-3-phosphate acyltransferase n=1 Tax=Phytoplasma mali (strain AT) TaxID=482235 RepID=B3QZX2_PHYMT|nr:lysophospholipid acyltransferase family protein [Candidatus Phytoplasma mali]CAP18509.1 1-acyl-sn-glycerol-3-phosphate acyltransferase [Candidatus Phytoplasma mali]